MTHQHKITDELTEEEPMTINQYELAKALVQLLGDLPKVSSPQTNYEHMALRNRILDYCAENAEEYTDLVGSEEDVEKKPCSVEEEEPDQTEELELLKLLADAHAWLGTEPTPMEAYAGSSCVSNMNEINRYHVIRATLIACNNYIMKKMP